MGSCRRECRSLHRTEPVCPIGGEVILVRCNMTGEGRASNIVEIDRTDISTAFFNDVVGGGTELRQSQVLFKFAFQESSSLRSSIGSPSKVLNMIQIFNMHFYDLKE